jgi:hypothetical protein
MTRRVGDPLLAVMPNGLLFTVDDMNDASD